MKLARMFRAATTAVVLGVVATACQTAPPPPVNRLPVGDLAVTRTPAGIEVRGGASDPDSPDQPVEVGITVNGERRMVAVADGVADGRDDRVVTTVSDLGGISTPVMIVCLDAKDNETPRWVPVACEAVVGTRIISNGAVGSVVDTASGLYWVHGVAIDPNRDGPVPMRLRSLAGGEEIDSVTFLADRDTSGTANPLVRTVADLLPAYGSHHGFDAAGILDTSGADAVELDAQRLDGTWEQVAHY